VQTEGLALRKCLKANLADDARLSTLLPGGVWIDAAPEIDANTKRPPVGPWLVVTLISGPDTLGGGAARLFSDPLLRCYVWATGNGSTAVKAVDLAARRVDAVLSALRYTASDDDADTANGDPVEPYEIRGFYREDFSFSHPPDEFGNLYTRAGGDYRGFVYLQNRCP
jgi:hypothetical protein